MKQTAKSLGVFFLVLYVLAISPLFWSHHHDFVVSYQDATPCEKVIYYGDNAHGCHHQSHFTKQEKHCFFCDYHVYFHHLQENTAETLVFTPHNHQIYNYLAVFTPIFITEVANKDPPFLLENYA